jgi:hypothetical protein
MRQFWDLASVFTLDWFGDHQANEAAIQSPLLRAEP